MKKAILLASVSLLVLGGIIILVIKKPELISPLSSISFSRKVNYHTYSFENLQKREYYQSEVKLEELIKEEDNYTSYLFSFGVDGRRITGMANIPKKEAKLPVAILIRGWVDEEIYQTGMGTEKMADYLANNGFLTLAPDLLGYGGSDSAFPDMLQTRFFRPITMITLLESLENLAKADTSRVVIWSHSNGGQIALSVLEITGREIPTSLWAPVSIGFPQSILYFADEMEDRGKMIRKVVAEFEKEYDASLYSINTYFSQIKAPIIVHQGLADEAIPWQWSDELVKQLGGLGKEITFFKYPEENHNFHFGSAPLARERDLEFFQRHLNL